MNFLKRMLFILCVPGIFLNSPVHADVQQEHPKALDSSLYSPWDLLNYETLSLSRMLDFVYNIEYEETLENLLSEEQVREIRDFIIFLARNGVCDDDIEGKQRLEEDIAELLSEDDEEPSWALSTFHGYPGVKIHLAIWEHQKTPVRTCGWVSKTFKKTKRFVKKHKKEIIIAAVVVAAATVIIVSTGGAGAAATAGALGAAAVGGIDGGDHPKPHINKPGEVYFEDDRHFSETEEHRVPVDQGFYQPQSEPIPHLRISDELIAQQTTSIKEELSEQLPDEPSNSPEKDQPTFWQTVADKGKEVGSFLTHKTLDIGLGIVEDASHICDYLDDYHDRTSPSEAFKETFLVPSDQLHQKIDTVFGTDYSATYGPEFRELQKQLPTDMPELLQTLGKDVAFCFIPVPGGKMGKVSKVAKTAKAIYEVAKAAGAISRTPMVGSPLTSPNPAPAPTQDVAPVPQQQGNIDVYQSVNKTTGEVQYVGITNNVARRQLEHWKSKGIDIEPIKGLSNLTKYDAKAVEQCLIEINGLEKNGGSLTNRINSIAQTNPKYAESLKRGAEILKEAGQTIE